MKTKSLLKIVFAIFLLNNGFIKPFAQNYLSVQGNKLVDSNGETVQLTGVNWFGFETSNLHVHGIWSRDTQSMLQQIKDQGFNVIRIPWCNDMLASSATFNIDAYGTDPYTGVSPMNEYESTLTKPIELLDVIVEWCQDNNMKIILDNHSRQTDGYMNEDLWYTDETSESDWIEDWVYLAERYKDYDAVIGMDLNNEPHDDATWGSSSSETDWNQAAERCGNAILEVNSNVLIIVEGVEDYDGDSYWWGGNLKGVADYPVELSDPNKLVYSPHEYGPTVHEQSWFLEDDFPDNMPDIWEEHFNFIHTQGISPLLIGEFGIRDADGLDEIWFDTFMAYMGEKGYSWTYWCWNPNSGDTGGILDDDWSTIVEWKMEKISPYLADEIPNGEAASKNENAPVAVISASETEGIDSLEVTFDASGSYDVNSDTLTYAWDFGDGSNATGETVTHMYTTGTYTATLTVSDGDNTGTASVSIVVSSSEDLPCDNPESISIPYSYDGTGEFCLVTSEEIGNVNSWNMTSVEINGEDYTNTYSSELPEKINGNYYIYCYGAYAYSHFEASNLKTASGIQSTSIINQLYPNPFTNQTTLKLDNPEKVTQIEIYSITGKRMKVIAPSDISDANHIGSQLNPGTYILQINSLDGNETILMNKISY